MKILIENLEFESVIGIYKHERKEKQKVVMDIYINYDYSGEYLDYSEVAKFVQQFIQTNGFFSIEEALLKLSEELKNAYKNIKNIKLRLRKPTILPNADVGVEFESD